MRLFATSALLVALGSFAFGDDAEVLPEGVARLRIIPSFTTADQTFDDKGKAQDASPSYQVTSLNAAFEFGITESVTLGLKWAPGYKLASSTDDIPSDLESNDKLILTGPEDLEIGTKIQVLGTAGFVKNDQFRVTFTPGLSIPLDSYNAEKEFENFLDGKEYRPTGASAHGSLGFGIKADADWLITEVFSVSFHTQAIQYLPREQVEFLTYATNAGTYQFLAQSPVLADGVTTNPYYGNPVAAKAAADTAVPIEKTKTEWGLTYTGELEPRAEIALAEKTSLTFGVPLIYEANLKNKVTYNEETTESDPAYTFSVRPGVSLFTYVGPLPIECKLDYAKAVAGKNADATGTLAFQLMLYYKFY